MEFTPTGPCQPLSVDDLNVTLVKKAGNAVKDVFSDASVLLKDHILIALVLDNGDINICLDTSLSSEEALSVLKIMYEGIERKFMEESKLETKQ